MANHRLALVCQISPIGTNNYCPKHDCFADTMSATKLITVTSTSLFSGLALTIQINF